MKNVCSESDLNVSFNKHKSIVGSTFNFILKALFTLNCSNLRRKQCIPGGYSAWKSLEDYFCVVLLTIASVDQILERIFYLVLCACFDPCCEKNILEIAEGALTFFCLWTSNYSQYISPRDFTRMRHLMQKNFFKLKKNEKAADEKFFNFTTQLLKKCVLSCSRGEITNMLPPAFQFPTVGTWDNNSEKQSYLEGSLEKIRVQQTSDSLGADRIGQPVIAIFGVTQDMLNFSEDEDDEEILPHDIQEPGPSQSQSAPEPRIPKGYNLLSDYACVNIWDFDMKEIARQWTLLDHRIFVAVPLYFLERCEWEAPRHSAESSEVRMCIDRFNAESCWVTQSILFEKTPEKRAALYMKYIFLATFLEELRNFNGIMAVLTGLQQVAFDVFVWLSTCPLFIVTIAGMHCTSGGNFILCG